MAFKDDLKIARGLLGLSQTALSNSLEIPKRTIEDWEADKRTPAKWVQNLVLEKLERTKELEKK